MEKQLKKPQQKDSPFSDRPATENGGSGAFKNENIAGKDGRDNANGPVHSFSFDQAFKLRNRLPTIDEENQGRPAGPGQTKAKTFPLLGGSRENGFNKRSR